MAKKKLKPVSIAGIEFDALIDEQKTMTATIPAYPVEKGFPVSDTIILDPLTLNMTLYVSNTPVTWLYKHGSSTTRVNKVCEEMEDLWLSKKLVKIVTSDAIYKNMGLKSISIKKSKEIGYAREITIQASKVVVTKKKTVKIPAYILKSGASKAKAGTATTSTTSKKSSAAESSSSTSKKSSAGKKGSSTSKKSSAGKKGSSSKSSIAYKVAKGLGIL